jgi:hypothetical protein
MLSDTDKFDPSASDPKFDVPCKESDSPPVKK